MPRTRLHNLGIFSLIVFGFPLSAASKKSEVPREIPTSTTLWMQPDDIASRDLYYGPGGKSHEPSGTFTFEKEDMNGTNPKFDVHDQDGVKWKVKLGEEARPETVASRLVWAVGYYADEDYFISDFKMEGIPAHVHRGAKDIGADGSVHNVRLKRYIKGEEKLGQWQWLADPFTGSREWNGLRVMMALMDNWDLKDVNNAIYQKDAKRIYLVTDLGASFGTTGRSYTRADSKGNLDAFEKSKFIVKTTPTTVDFMTPSRPAFVHVVEVPEYKERVHMEWIGKNIPRADAKWMGGLLSQLSPDQIQSAFRAAGYSPDEVQRFSAVVEKRIAELNQL